MARWAERLRGRRTLDSKDLHRAPDSQRNLTEGKETKNSATAIT